MDKMVSVNKDRLVFAREYYGLSLDEVAHKINKKVELIKKWESGEEFPSYAQLSSLADFYNQPLFFFFMRGLPSKSKVEVAFRGIEQSSGIGLSKRVREMMENAELYRLNLLEIYEGQNVSNFKKMIESDNVIKDNLADWLRNKLDLPLNKQQKEYRHSNELIEYIRIKFYEIGVYIFKDSFQDNNVSGLCLYDEKFPVILLNNKTTFNRQLFTIFHEIYHLYCEEADIDFIKGRREKNCDTFASEFLIPESDFSERIKNIRDFENRNIISQLANLYTVSEEAIAYRLKKKNKITQELYNNVREDSIRHMNSESSGGNFYFTRISYLGRPYLNKVFDMYYSGKLSISEVGVYTQLKSVHVSKLASNLFGGGF